MRRSVHDREIARLALPALGALAAEPLYLLVDTAIVGHLGTPQLAARGDMRFLAGSMLLAGLGAYIPIALLALALDWGIQGVWVGLLGLMAVRLATLGWRFVGRRWAVTGAGVARGRTRAAAARSR